VNVEGTRNILAACEAARVRRLVWVGSTAAVGVPRDPGSPAGESFSFNLDRDEYGYARSKHEAERLALEAGRRGLDIVVVHPGFVFGPRGESYRGGEVIRRVTERRWVACSGGGLSIVHVDDLAKGILAAAERSPGGRRYILSGDNLTFAEIARIVRERTGARVRIVRIPDPVRDVVGYLIDRLATALGSTRRAFPRGDLSYLFYDSARARRELAFEPRPFGDIVDDYIAWRSARTRAGAPSPRRG
jgi:dihydroflavonol-4-reductase